MNMKKVSKTLAVALVALSAMYIKSMTKEQSAHELLLLNNIEALASGEDDGSDEADYYCVGKEISFPSHSLTKRAIFSFSDSLHPVKKERSRSIK